MSRARERTNRAMLRVRDAIDRDYGTELDVEALARLAHLSPDHLIRTFRGVFGETPHRYLQRRRIERAMFLLRTTDLEYARRDPLPPVPGCFLMAWTRPSTFTHSRGTAPADGSISEKP